MTWYSSLRFGPFSRRECFHRQGMNLVVLHFVAQGGVNLLVARNEAQPLKLIGHHHRLPMAAITVHGEVLA